MREQAIAVELTERGPSNLVLLTLELTQEEDVWVGTCIELGTSAYADSIEELRGEIADAIGLQLNEAMRLGFLDEYIEERTCERSFRNSEQAYGVSRSANASRSIGCELRASNSEQIS